MTGAEFVGILFFVVFGVVMATIWYREDKRIDT